MHLEKKNLLVLVLLQKCYAITLYTTAGDVWKEKKTFIYFFWGGGVGVVQIVLVCHLLPASVCEKSFDLLPT